MPNRFSKHYTRQEARALLPQIRKWLEELNRHRQFFAENDQKVQRLLDQGQDVGGETVNRCVKTLGAVKNILRHFEKRQIQIKDIERGLIDFPAFIAGREVFLCWEQGEEDVEFWHELDTGYAGRERIQDEE